MRPILLSLALRSISEGFISHGKKQTQEPILLRISKRKALNWSFYSDTQALRQLPITLVGISTLSQWYFSFIRAISQWNRCCSGGRQLQIKPMYVLHAISFQSQHHVPL